MESRIVGRVRAPFVSTLEQVQVQAKSVRVYGKAYPQPRLTQYYGPVPYTYSGLTWPALEMPRVIERLLAEVEALTKDRFNAVLLNLYRDGQDTIGWHSDDEPLFGPDPAVASLSLGSTRMFVMRRKDNHRVQERFALDHGSVLYMPPGTQKIWQHSVPRTKRPVGPRLNLTFRRIVT